MEGKGYTTASVSGGTLFGSWAGIKNILAGKVSAWHIDWASLYQVAIQAAVGAFIGLIIKLLWDITVKGIWKRFFKNKKYK